MPRALILSYYFYPSRQVGAKRLSELACHLRDEGWDVTVITSPSRDSAPELAQRIQGISVVTVAAPPKLYQSLARWPKRLLRGLGHDNKSHPTATPDEHAAAHSTETPHTGTRREPWLAWLKRHYHALEHTVDDRKLWAAIVALRGLILRQRFDWIITSGPVHSVHLSGRLIARATGARWIIDLRDPWVCNHHWPDQAKTESALRNRMERYLERDCVMHADRVTVASPGIGKALQVRIPQAATKVHVVLNGYDGSVASDAVPTGRLRLLYTGSLYLNRNPFPLLEALQELLRMPGVDRERLRFTMVGLCERWNGRDVVAWVKDAGMEDVVQVLPPVSSAAAAAMMDEAEVLVNFAQGQPEQIPAKMYDYIASRKEMLLIAEGDSDAARLTLESGAGRVADPGEPAALPGVLRDLYTFYIDHGQAFALDTSVIERFSRRRQNRRFMELLAAPAAS